MSIISVAGSLLIRERIAIDPGAIATVKIVDAEGEVLGATAVEATGIPVDFAVTIDEEFITGDLFVWAVLRTNVGAWGTLELEPYTGDSAEVVLTRIED
jgi:putative lipoprotein